MEVINNFQHYPPNLIAYNKYPFIKGSWVFEIFENRGEEGGGVQIFPIKMEGW